MKVKTSRINRKKLSWLLEQDIDVKMEILLNHLEISRMLINDIFDDEVTQFAGTRYSRSRPHNGRYNRWGFNPGSVKIGNESIRVDIPRMYDNQDKENIPLETYQQLKSKSRLDENVLRAVLLGLSTRDYKRVIQGLMDSFGLSHSSVSNRFIEASSEKLEEFSKRDLSQYEFLGLFIDGKSLAREQIILVLGVTIGGDKIPLGFIQTHSENSTCIKELLSELVARGLNYREGLLCVIDGSKGIRKAINDVFGNYALIQRCKWHKRENVLSYLKDSIQDTYRSKINRAYNAETYLEAKRQLKAIIEDLKTENLSAARSLEEGLEETLTLHKLGLADDFGRSFNTTNCIENVNSLIEKHTGKVKYWKNSGQRHRWIASALLEIEHRMRKVNNHKNLSLLKEKVAQEVVKQIERDQEAA